MIFSPGSQGAFKVIPFAFAKLCAVSLYFLATLAGFSPALTVWNRHQSRCFSGTVPSACRNFSRLPGGRFSTYFGSLSGVDQRSSPGFRSIISFTGMSMAWAAKRKSMGPVNVTLSTFNGSSGTTWNPYAQGSFIMIRVAIIMGT